MTLEKIGEVTGRRETLEASDEVIRNIAARNEDMTPQQVRAALEKGQTVCTFFASYRRAPA